MARIKKIPIFPFARFQAALAALLGLLAGIIYSFGGLIVDAAVTLNWISPSIADTPGLSHGTILAFGALFGMPLIAGVGGFFLGILEALLYNIFSKWFDTIQKPF